MKLRRLFPAAALCLFVGAALAVEEEPADGDSRRELIYSFGEVTASAKEDNSMAEALIQYAGASDPGNGWPESVSYLNDESEETDDTLREYDFAVPFDESVTDSIGFVGFIDDYGERVLPGGSATTAGDSSLDKTIYSIFYFEKKAYRNTPNTIRILSERSLSENLEKKEEDDSIITPLSAPFSLLIMILGFGVLMVTYTSKTKE